MNKDTKIIKFICNIFMGLSLFGILGLVGGLESGSITLNHFDEYAVICVVVLCISFYVSSKMEKIESERDDNGC